MQRGLVHGILIMNVLALIQARLQKTARIAAAQKSLVYRGVSHPKD